MREEFRPAIEALETDLADLLKKTSETKRMINRLYELSGMPEPYPEADEPEQQIGGAIRADQFYGKNVTTASREYLEMRKVANRGPATPREIFDALVEGGFKFDAKNDENAMTGLRQTLRKNSAVFHRLPNGQYGLLSWYPNAKNMKSESDRDTPPVKSRKRRRKTSAASATSSEPPISEKILKVMGNGAQWTMERIKQEIPSTGGRQIQGALMGLKGRGLIENVERGVWKIVSGNPVSEAGQNESEAAADEEPAAAV